MIIHLSRFVKKCLSFTLSGPAPVVYVLEDRHPMHASYPRTNEPRHEISNNVVCATSKASDQPAHSAV